MSVEGVIGKLQEAKQLIGDAPASVPKEKLDTIRIPSQPVELGAFAVFIVGVQKTIEEAHEASRITSQTAIEGGTILKGALKGTNSEAATAIFNSVGRMGGHAGTEADVLVTAHEKTVEIGHALRHLLSLTQELGEMVSAANGSDAQRMPDAQRQAVGWIESYELTLGTQ